MIVIGIDPGKTGAVAIHEGIGWDVHDCPTIQVKQGKSKKDVPDPVLMAELLRPFAGKPVHVFLEQVSANPKQGVTSMFNFGMGYGVWKGVIAAYQFQLTYVTPQRWKKTMMAGLDKSSKGASRQRALQLFPDQASMLTRVKDDGRAEAILIGEFGRKELGLCER